VKALLDAVLLDIGGTLVHEAAPGTAIEDLEVRLRDDVVDDLVWLGRTVRVGAVTDTAVLDEAAVRRLLEPSGLSERLEVLVTSVEAGAAKPDPTSIRLALERLGLDDPARILYIGDQPADEQAAEAAGTLYTAVAALGARDGGGDDPDPTIRQVVQAWLERAAGRRFEEARARIAKSDIDAANAAAALQNQLTKPPGALGRMETLGVQLAGIAAICPPPVPEPVTIGVFAADHGIVDWGVSPWPQEVTAQMVANFAAGGAAINVLARHVEAEVVVVDVGVAHPIPVTADDQGNLLRRCVRRGTSNLAAGPAMTRVEALLALDIGVEVAERAVTAGARCLVTGEMGIGNTTSATAIISHITNSTPQDITGRGSGADDEMLARKRAIIEAAIGGLASTAGPLTVLEQIGGFEIAAMAGFVVGGAAARVPVIIDGVIADAALLIAAQLSPDVIDYVIAGHRSTEPAARAALDFLGLDPVLDLDLRLGEGTGATMAVSVVQAAAKVLREMATFDSAGVARDKD
jgi:nicotinate-nucleotide--dimethylbenzimidazole phosphoribosyltransferase